MEIRSRHSDPRFLIASRSANKSLAVIMIIIFRSNGRTRYKTTNVSLNVQPLLSLCSLGKRSFFFFFFFFFPPGDRDSSIDGLVLFSSRCFPTGVSVRERERAREGVLKNVGNNSSRFDRKRVIISMEHLLSTSSKDFSPLLFELFFTASSIFVEILKLDRDATSVAIWSSYCDKSSWFFFLSQNLVHEVSQPTIVGL